MNVNGVKYSMTLPTTTSSYDDFIASLMYKIVEGPPKRDTRRPYKVAAMSQFLTVGA